MNLITIAENAAKVGLNNIWNAVAILIVLTVVKMSLSPSKASKEYQETIKKQADEHTQTLQNLNKTLETISSKIEGWDRNVFEELRELEERMKRYELIITTNTIQYVRLAFKSIPIDKECISNKAHDKRLCPYSDNVLCTTMETFKTRLFREFDKYIIDDVVMERLRKIAETYVQPDEDIKDYLDKMQNEMVKAIK